MAALENNALPNQALLRLRPADTASIANERFGFTLFVSICVHVVLILGVGYKVLEEMHTETSIDITLAQYRSDNAPDLADFMAQENQIGSGDLEEKAAPSTPIHSRFNADQIQDLSPFVPTQNQTSNLQQSILTIETATEDQISKEKESDELTPLEPAQLLAEIRPDQFDQTLASLQAQLDTHRQKYAKRPRKHTISSASTKQARDALYLDTWRKKIESVGNLNYPQQASQAKIYGKLRLLVALKPDGSVNEVRILSSSGHNVLDDAAIKIVQLAAPFSPFPDDMRRDVDILEIIRTWQFHTSDSFRSF